MCLQRERSVVFAPELNSIDGGGGGGGGAARGQSGDMERQGIADRARWRTVDAIQNGFVFIGIGPWLAGQLSSAAGARPSGRRGTCDKAPIDCAGLLWAALVNHQGPCRARPRLIGIVYFRPARSSWPRLSRQSEWPQARAPSDHRLLGAALIACPLYKLAWRAQQSGTHARNNDEPKTMGNNRQFAASCLWRSPRLRDPGHR